jgi:hypothetical protein
MATKMSAEEWRRDRDNFLLDLGAFAELRAMGRDIFLLTIKEPAEALGRDWDNFPAPLRLLTDSWATGKLSGAWGKDVEWAWEAGTTRLLRPGRRHLGMAGQCSGKWEQLRAQVLTDRTDVTERCPHRSVRETAIEAEGIWLRRGLLMSCVPSTRKTLAILTIWCGRLRRRSWR